jgi:hypothetical protein
MLEPLSGLRGAFYWPAGVTLLIGVGSRRRSASQAIDLLSDGGVKLESFFTPELELLGEGLAQSLAHLLSHVALMRFDEERGGFTP